MDEHPEVIYHAGLHLMGLLARPDCPLVSHPTIINDIVWGEGGTDCSLIRPLGYLRLWYGPQRGKQGDKICSTASHWLRAAEHNMRGGWKSPRQKWTPTWRSCVI